MLTGMFIFYHLGFILPMFGFLVMMFFIFVMMSFFRRRWRRTPVYFDRSTRNRSFPYYDGWWCGPGMWFDRDFEDISYSSETSLDILKKRYAKGEISKEEFDRMKRDIL